MAQMSAPIERQTSADVVFDHLYAQIVALKLLPGAKMSEVEIANQFSVSRQPVRDAFARLGNLGLLQIRPQKATVVRKFSMEEIAQARFVRAAIEIEVMRRACKIWSDVDTSKVAENLEKQKTVVGSGETHLFHDLDYDFHRLLCETAECDFAFRTIADMKVKVDRLCTLSLERSAEMTVLLDDHMQILAGLERNDFPAVEAATRLHLSRLDRTIMDIRERHGEYFEAETDS